MPQNAPATLGWPEVSAALTALRLTLVDLSFLAIAPPGGDGSPGYVSFNAFETNADGSRYRDADGNPVEYHQEYELPPAVIPPVTVKVGL